MSTAEHRTSSASGIAEQQAAGLSGSEAEPDRDDVPGLDRVERLPGASHWVHHDEHERVNQLLIDFFARALPAKEPGQVTIPMPSATLAPQA
jgi:hypothetical protein